MIRVLLAEDQTILRGALVAVLELAGLAVVAELDRGDTVPGAAARTRPDVAVLDIDLPGLDGISAAVRLRAELPACRVLVLTGLGQPAHVLRALAAGVDGFLLKSASADDFVDAVRAVAAGAAVIDPELVATARGAGVSPLTVREAEILAVAADGAPINDLARRLHLAPATVRNHLSSAIAKTGARNRLEALNRARGAGWI